ncbi:unnamed protein product [Darwinula stevensoni]|uniref:Elongation of very long chain fatty acids protein n=1 Tax=Darwinula stevensoni TaxID=69355 RepID=A0A7R9ADX8_9CRUS|nr:unnamed protein product [Darwinula stevensoni]CAG0901766.1 unnamed protein product [Darwinula stevensoni]
MEFPREGKNGSARVQCGFSSCAAMFDDLSAYPKPPYRIYPRLSRYEQCMRYHEDVRKSGIPHNTENLPYYFIFDWELNGERAEYVQLWFMHNWTLSFVIAAVYLILVFLGRRWMRSRPPWNLTKALILWNVFISLGTIIGLTRAVPEVIRSLRGNSLYSSLCFGNHMRHNPVAANWALVFVLSKVGELGDTAFIILRKQRLIFLHWYHHLTVLLYTWYSCAQAIPAARLGATLNGLVHAFMYSYYAARAAKIRVPRRIAMFITLFQLTQMVFGIYISVYAYLAKKAGLHCETPWENIYVSFLMYLSYFLLFLNFFFHAYMKRSSRAVKAEVAKGKSIGEELMEFLKIN